MAKTLMEMAGADLTPPALKDTTLLIIDAQNEYVTGKLPLPGVDAALSNIGMLIAKARAGGSPVVHVRHKGRPGGLFDPEQDNFAIHSSVSPAAGETVVDKALPNAFAGTTLDATLKNIGAKRLVIVGFMSHMCISSTARAALDLGYQTVVPHDASATRDLPSPDGDGVIAAADIHRAELAALADRFALVCAAADLG
ncbi:cysteine hydrolase family protein [Pararhizobium haloflavum]|uniref:cysteine hydrolase family protein n=1 Tax=Pararhizobium haloflavum TaxID=2037914 RepID=UPI000C196472|nr:cysteine hydrolase family protein [Pararhizobium haloflavum]